MLESVNTYKTFKLEQTLKKALEKKEFRLYYQPKLDLVSGDIIGVEALVRWEHPEKGIISPLEFIPVAEETGLIIPIGEWVLRTACKQNVAWQDAGLPPRIMAVNLSARQLYQPNLVEMIQEILEETKLAPEYLELEITESMTMDVHNVLPILQDLKSIGIQISMDDFGTGYSSLYHLKEFPIDIVKIDQSFVRTCMVDPKDATIVKTIIAMAHQLNLEVIAEGVESKEHLIFLQQNLCNQGQGYLFSKPLPPEELIQKFDDMEQIVHQDGIPQEVNRQKWLEEALEQARQELKDTLRMQQGMIFKFIERDGKFIHTLCDGELLYRMNLTPEQVIGKELHDFLPDSVAETKLQYLSKAWQGEENVSYEAKINDIWYYATLRPIRRGGKVVEVIGSCVDITERKKIEEHLKSSESHYRLIAENTQDLIGLLDVNGMVHYASPSHEKVLGFSPQVYEGHLAFDMVHPDDVFHIQTHYANMVVSKTPCYVEFRYKHANGGWVYVEAIGTPVLDEKNEVKHFVVVARDITERKKAEELIRKSERLSIVGQLGASVAHEIRNPLTSIKGFVQLLQKEGEKPFYTDILLSEIDRLEDIVKGFLSLSKPLPPHKEEIDAKILLQQVVRLFESQAILKSVEIIQDPCLDSPVIYCDENQIKQVFINILQNAVEAMPNGGIIKIQMLWHNSDSIKFRFIDQDHGISEKRIKKIGEPFFSTKEKGTGLGLMVSQNTVQEHDGTINIGSAMNRGTTVEVILPIK